MAAHPKPLLMTVEELYDLPERDDVTVELHWGSLVELSRPKPWHHKLQKRIAALLEKRSGVSRNRTVFPRLRNMIFAPPMLE